MGRAAAERPGASHDPAQAERRRVQLAALDAVQAASDSDPTASTISVGSSPDTTPTTRNVLPRRIGIVSPARHRLRSLVAWAEPRRLRSVMRLGVTGLWGGCFPKSKVQGSLPRAVVLGGRGRR
jgi:hypothetical protein